MHRRIKRLTKSFHYATKGIRHALKTQQNIWIHFFIGSLIVLLAIFLGFDLTKLSIIVLTIALVLVLEMINTVAETIVDLAAPEFSELGRIAKDVAAGAVLIAALFSIIIGIMLFALPLFKLFFPTY